MAPETENGSNNGETAGRMNSAGRDRALPRKMRFVLLACAAALPVIVMFLLVVLLPVKRLQQTLAMDSQVADESAASGKRDESSTPQSKEQIILLRLDEAFWQARLKLSKQGSVSLAVNFEDSIASLEIYGVPVRKCRIHRYKASHVIDLLRNRSEFLVRLSKPLNVQSEMGTFPKEPIRVERAPRDSIEASKAAARPFEPEKVEAYFTLFLDDNLSLTIEQLEEPPFEKFFQIFAFRMERQIRQARQAISALANLNLPTHQQRIEITLGRDDAKAIYRALGNNAECALKL